MMRTERRRGFFRAKGKSCLCLAIALSISLSTWCEQVELENGVMLNYVVVDGGVHVGNTNAPYAAVSPETSGRIILPDSIAGLPVTDVGAFAFHSCTNLTEVSLPASVRNIGEASFRNCTKLEAIDIPEGLVRIGKNAFRGCSDIRSLAFPDSLRVLNDSAFAECKAIRSIVIPGGVNILGELVPSPSGAKETTIESATSTSILPTGALISSTFTKEIVADEKDWGVFEGCDALESATIMDGVKELGPRAFSHCRNLSSVALPESIEIRRRSISLMGIRWSRGRRKSRTRHFRASTASTARCP